jgi:hypothetical protein
LNVPFVPQIGELGAAIVAGVADQQRINRGREMALAVLASGLICLSAALNRIASGRRARPASLKRVSSFRDEEFPVSKISVGSLACGLDYRHPRVAGKNAGNG